MKKFSQINESTNMKNLSFEEKVEILIKHLDVVIDNDTEIANKNIEISTNEDFMNGIKGLLTETFLVEKLNLLDRIKRTYHTGDASWIDSEISIIKENLK